MEDTHVSLAHGNGGRYMRELIAEVFARHLANPYLHNRYRRGDPAVDASASELAFTTDSFHRAADRVPRRQHRFAGRARHDERSRGRGAIPKYLSLGVLLEEGLSSRCWSGSSQALQRPRADRRSRGGPGRRSCAAAKVAASTSTPAASA
jgi:hydrogenase maturation factor